jgi:hypothetical protein
MKKILSIGNSFSVDALFYFSRMTEAAGLEIDTFNLYIGGCSLRQHANNLETGAQSYACYLNGEATQRMASIAEALQEEDWDIITIQQVSYESGIPESYEPYGTNLINYVRETAPRAKLWFHKTWAYEHGSDHPEFPRYDCDQIKMYQALSTAAAEFTAKHTLPVIPAGDVVQALRQLPEFDYLNGGLSLCRDGFHMSETYGRYAVAATWFEMLTGESILENSFMPEDTDAELLKKVKQVVHGFCAGLK